MLRLHAFLAGALALVVVLSLLGVLVSLSDANFLRAGLLAVLMCVSALGAKAFATAAANRRSASMR